MSNKGQKNWENNLYQQDTSKEKSGANAKANLSGKKQGELYQQYLKGNQELQKEQKTEKTVAQHKRQKYDETSTLLGTFDSNSPQPSSRAIEGQTTTLYYDPAGVLHDQPMMLLNPDEDNIKSAIKDFTQQEKNRIKAHLNANLENSIPPDRKRHIVREQMNTLALSLRYELEGHKERAKALSELSRIGYKYLDNLIKNTIINIRSHATLHERHDKRGAYNLRDEHRQLAEKLTAIFKNLQIARAQIDPDYINHVIRSKLGHDQQTLREVTPDRAADAWSNAKEELDTLRGDTAKDLMNDLLNNLRDLPNF